MRRESNMTPEEKARQLIDARLVQSGWAVQDLEKVNPMASLGVAVREYPTSTGPGIKGRKMLHVIADRIALCE